MIGKIRDFYFFFSKYEHAEWKEPIHFEGKGTGKSD